MHTLVYRGFTFTVLGRRRVPSYFNLIRVNYQGFSPRNWEGGVHLNEWLSSFIYSPHLPLLKADWETGKYMDNQPCLGN